jgi:hypothetical protein
MIELIVRRILGLRIGMLSLMPEKFIIPVACTNAKIHQKVSAAFF